MLKLPFAATCCIFVWLALALTHCGEPTHNPQVPVPSVPDRIQPTPEYNGHNALYHAAKITAIGDRASDSPGYRKQLDYLKEQLAQCGWQCQETAFTVENTPAGKVQFVNLRARFGKLDTDFNKPLEGIVSCHIDTKQGIKGFVGANDGASGAAALLELARILTDTPQRAQQVELVFFDGEESFGKHMTAEDGLFGSKYYMQHMPAGAIQWQINLDMVGRQGMKIRIPPNTSHKLYRMYTQAIRDLGLRKETWGVATGGILDDHIPFMEAGIDTLNLIDDFTDGNWWHTANDNMGILCADSFQQTGNLVLHLLRQLVPVSS